MLWRETEKAFEPVRMQFSSAVRFNTKEISEDSIETTTFVIEIVVECDNVFLGVNLQLQKMIMSDMSDEMKDVYEMTDACQSNTLT